MTQNNRPAQRRPAAAPGRRPAQGVRRPAVRQSAPVRPAGRQGAPARPTRPSPAPRSTGGLLSDFIPRGFWLLALVGAAAIAFSVWLTYRLPNGFVLRQDPDQERPVAAAVSEIHSGGPLRLNEIMTSNSGAVMDAEGKTPDWIEVANVSGHDVNLKGYVLARSAKAGNVFVFPEMTLPAGGFVVVYADSQLRAEAGQELHAPFRLSSGGDVLMLFNASEVAVDTVNLPAMPANSAYVRRDRNLWEVDAMITPGAANTAESYAAMNTLASGSSVQLAEMVASNTHYAPDDSGAVHDYILLRNTSGSAVDIGGWYLSDDPAVSRLWRFPEGASVPAGGTLIVYCSGESRTDDPRHLHTSFRLSSEGETVTLSNAAGQPVDQTRYDLLKTDAAWLRGSDGNWGVGTPTT